LPVIALPHHHLLLSKVNQGFIRVILQAREAKILWSRKTTRTTKSDMDEEGYLEFLNMLKHPTSTTRATADVFTISILSSQQRLVEWARTQLCISPPILSWECILRMASSV
jgi:hypothetical protein